MNAAQLELREQIAQEISAKRQLMVGFHPAQKGLIDGEVFDGFLRFLLGLSDLIPSGLDYSELPRGEDWLLQDLSPRNSTHLAWEIITLCRLPGALPLFRIMDTSNGKSSTLGKSKSIDFEEAFAMNHPLGRFGLALLMRMLPQFRECHDWRFTRIEHLGQNLGFVVFSSDPGPSRNREGKASLNPLLLYQEPMIETVCSRFIRLAKHAGLLAGNGWMIVLLYSSRNAAYYLSGRRETMCMGQILRKAEDLAALRQETHSALVNRRRSLARKPPPLRLLDSLDNKHADLMAKFTMELASDITSCQHHMFYHGYREAISLNPGKPIDRYVLANLHLAQPYIGATLSSLRDESIHLKRVLVYRSSRTRAAAEPLLGDLETDELAILNELLLTTTGPALSDLLRLQLSRPELQPVSHASLDKYHRKILKDCFNTYLQPQSLLRLPIIPPPGDNSILPSIIDLYFNKPVSAIHPYAEGIADFIGRAFLNGREFQAALERERQASRIAVVGQVGHTVGNWFQSVLYKIESLRTEEDRKELRIELEQMFDLLWASKLLVRGTWSNEHLGRFFPQTEPLGALLRGSIKRVVDGLATNGNLVLKVLKRRLPQGEAATEFSGKLDVVIPDEAKSAAIRTVPNLVSAILMESLDNAFKYCDWKSLDPLRIKVLYEGPGLPAYALVSSPLDREGAKRLIAYMNRVRTQTEVGLGLRAVCLYTELLGHVLGTRFQDPLPTVVPPGLPGTKLSAMMKLPLGVAKGEERRK
jgi:hypothetical protein